jgi:peptidylprolyl isomerase
VSPDQKVCSVLRRLRRPTAALCAVLLAPALVACGGSDNADDPNSAAESSEPSGAAAGELDEVSFSGEVGESITAK